MSSDSESNNDLNDQQMGGDVSIYAGEISNPFSNMGDRDIGTCCRCPFYADTSLESKINAVKSSLYILENPNLNLDINCLTNEIENSTKVICDFCENEEDKNVKLNCADTYLRSRHEILFRLSMLSLGINSDASDQRFCDVLNISSTRTPDYISIIENSVFIIECTASSDINKSHSSKGKIEAGFQSKYEKEIRELQSCGYIVNYFVLAFDMKDIMNNSHNNEIKNISKIMNTELEPEFMFKLDYVRRCYCNLNKYETKSLKSYMVHLFFDEYKPFRKSDFILDFLLEPGVQKDIKFDRIGVSNNVYNRLISSWPKLFGILENTFHETEDKLYLKLDLYKNRFSFKKGEGLTYNEWVQVLTYYDKPNLVKHLKLFLNDTPHQERNMEIEFFEESHISNTESKIDLKLMPHPSSSNFLKTDFIFNDFKNVIDSSLLLGKKLKYSDPNYNALLIEKVSDFFKDNEETKSFNENLKTFGNKKPFVCNKVDIDQITRAVNDYSEVYSNMNSFDPKRRLIMHQKAAFQYPLIDNNKQEYVKYTSKIDPFIESLFRVDLGPYTNEIIKRISHPDFYFGGEPEPLKGSDLRMHDEYAKKQRELNHIQKCHFLQNKRFTKAKNIPDAVKILSDMKIIRQKMKGNTSSKKKKISTVRLPTKGKSLFKEHFSIEMSHFKKKKEKSSFKGVGTYDQEILKSEFSSIMQFLSSPSMSTCPDELYDENIGEDIKLLSQLKSDYIDKYKCMNSTLRNTNIYHCAAFVSRLCHTLSFVSQSTLSGDYVYADNLGYSKTLLLIKGGKKIFSTKQSKLFKIIYPIPKETANWLCRSGYESSTKVWLQDDTWLASTPWHYMEETLLNDGLTFLNRSMGFVILNSKNEEMFRKQYFNVLLAFHARRQTESFLHNTRYLVVNCMSTISNIDKMLPELAGFNYDFFQAYIRGCLEKGFGPLAMSLQDFYKDEERDGTENAIVRSNIKHLFDDDVCIETLSDLTLMIYCTFLMTKAPVTQSLEQAKNLTNMLKTHKEHKEVRSDNPIEQYSESTIKMSKDDDIKSYWEKIFKNDFIYDPTYVTVLGNFATDFLLKQKTKEELSSKWTNLLNEPWDNMANTKGLRGDRGKNFFNKKGYFIVYEHILKDHEYRNNVESLIFNDERTDHEKKTLLSKLNQTFNKKLQDIEVKELIFHVVDKRQRGGNREIFVMDYKTKLAQQPIENYCKYLCKLFPNEMISIPSNKRLFHIHSNVFEKRKTDENSYYNAVLDCRRWAPHSVINKFCDFILSMHGSLPQSFIKHVISFMELMFDKKIYTRKYVYDIMQKNEGLKESVENYLVSDDQGDGYYFTMSYSWVMGIFNYFSSLLHVVNQMHASYVINNAGNHSISSNITYHMIAHSDDSAGRIGAPDELCMRKSFLIYEMLLKSANHMLSDKKCNIGKKYFEFLSILYISNQLLTLMVKFIGTFNFHPSDKGYCIDIRESYSKCVDLMVMGCTFDKSYIAMKIMNQLIYRFYFNTNIPKLYYNIPIQMFGVPDSHPLMVLCCGSDSDTIRLMKVKGEEYMKRMMFLNDWFKNDFEAEDAFFHSLVSKPEIRIGADAKALSMSINLKDLTENKRWIYSKVNSGNTAINCVRLMILLKNSHFCAALMDENLTRRISRAFYFRKSSCIETVYRSMTYSEVKDMIEFYYHNDSLKIEGLEEINEEIDSEYKRSMSNKTYINRIGVLNEIFSEIKGFIDSIDDFSYKKEDVIFKPKTCKPVHINIQKSSLPLSISTAPESLSAWIKEPEIRWVLPIGDYANSEKTLISYLETKDINLDQLNIQDVYNLLCKFKQKYVKEFFMYCNLPHGSRDVSTYKDLLLMLAENSFEFKYINGIITPFSKKIDFQPKSVLELSMTEKDLDFVTVADFYSSIICKPELRVDFKRLKLNPDSLGFKNIRQMSDLIIKMIKECGSGGDMSLIYTPHMESLLNVGQNNVVTNTEPLKRTFYNCFVKTQMLVGNVWLGKGELYINMPDIKMLLGINNMTIVSVVLNKQKYNFKRIEQLYIESVLQKAQLGSFSNSMISYGEKDWRKQKIGLDQNGFLVVDQVRNLSSYINDTSYSQFPTLLVANLERSTTKVLPRFRYQVTEREFDFKEKFILKTVESTPSRMIQTMGKILNNETNRRTIDERGLSFNDYFEALVGDVTNVELKINKRDLFENFSLSKIYAIMKHCRDKEITNFKTLRIRKPLYPAQEDGFLNCMIRYKEQDPDFRFEPNKILTPEMMHLKSTQPETFMTEMATKIKEKFRLLYTDVDKDIIMKSLHSLIKNRDKENFLDDLIRLMSVWGYVGVMGSIEQMDSSRSNKVYQLVYYSPSQDYMKKISRNFVIKIFNAIMKTLSTTGKYPGQCSGLEHLPSNQEQLRLFLTSYLFIKLIQIYGEKSNPFMKLLKCEIQMFEFVQYILSQNEVCNGLMDEFESDPFLQNLSVSEECILEFTSLIKYSVCNIYYSEFYGLDINYCMKRIDTSPHQLPLKVLRDDFREVLQFDLKNVNRGGVLSLDEINFLNRSHIFTHKNRLYKVDFEICNLSDQYIPFKPALFIKRPLTQDFIEDEEEFEEFTTELEFDGLEEEDVEHLHYEMVIPYDRRIFLNTGNKSGSGRFLDVKIVSFIGKTHNNDPLGFIRQVGETIIIITDGIFFNMLQQKSDHFQFFEPIRTMNQNTVCLPSGLYYIVIDSHPIDVDFWCHILSLRNVSRSEIQSKGIVSCSTRYKDNAVLETEYFFSSQDIESAAEELDQLNHLREEASNTENFKELKVAKVEKELTKTEILREKGLSDDFVQKYKNIITKFSDIEFGKLSDWENVSKIFEDYFNNTLNKDFLISSINQALGKVKSSKIIDSIWQVPTVFSLGNPQSSSIRNRSLKDSKLRAEVESLCPGITNLILSGTLKISDNCRRIFSKHIRLCKNSLLGITNFKSEKLLILNFLTLISNDAMRSEDINHDFMFDNLMKFITDIIIDDMEDEVDLDDPFNTIPGKANLVYGMG